MKITRELIEKYHDGLCTPEEELAIQNWLSDDGTPAEYIAPLPAGESRFKMQDDMWKEISTVLPAQKESAFIRFFRPWPRQAAAVILITLGSLGAFYLKNEARENATIVMSNVSATSNKDINESAYFISLGPKSNVAIDNSTGKIDFCGAVMINPKRDIEFTIQGTCARADDRSEKMLLKKGQNYIALHYDNQSSSNEVIILPKGSLTGLPPLVQRQLMMQFNI